MLVGKDEIPYGIQKDLLCAQSPYYRELFATQGEAQVEHLVKLPDTDAETFGCFQNFIYTGNVYDRRSGREIPDYPLLMGVWKLGTELKMAPLRTAVLNVMAERRQLTSAIPGTALLKQAWIETEEGSELRKLFIGWAAEHSESFTSLIQIVIDYHIDMPSYTLNSALFSRNSKYFREVTSSRDLK